MSVHCLDLVHYDYTRINTRDILGVRMNFNGIGKSRGKSVKLVTLCLLYCEITGLRNSLIRNFPVH